MEKTNWDSFFSGSQLLLEKSVIWQRAKTRLNQHVNHYDCQALLQDHLQTLVPYIRMFVNYVEAVGNSITKNVTQTNKILTQNTTTAIKNAAKEKKQELYREIAHLDIVAR